VEGGIPAGCRTADAIAAHLWEAAILSGAEDHQAWNSGGCHGLRRDRHPEGESAAESEA